MKRGLFKHSGEMNASAPLLMLVGGGIGGFFIAFVVTFLGDLLPFLMLRLILLGAYVYALSFMNNFLMEKGHLRNPTLAGVFGFLVGAITWYWSWVALFYLGTDDGMIVLNPAHLWTLASVLADQGYWEFEDSTMGAGVTWTLWALEVLIVVGSAGHFARNHVRETGYCEDCSHWLHNTTTTGPFNQVEDPKTFRRNLEDGVVEPLFNLDVAQTNPFWMVDVTTCDQCQNFHLGRLMEVTIGDENKTERDELTGWFHMTGEDVDRVTALAESFGED